VSVRVQVKRHNGSAHTHDIQRKTYAERGHVVLLVVVVVPPRSGTDCAEHLMEGGERGQEGGTNLYGQAREDKRDMQDSLLVMRCARER
jgi:hypothetical protein